MKRRLDKQLLAVSIGIGMGIALIYFGLSSATTGREATKIPAVIESMSPGPGDEVLQQSQIFIDFIEGYEASLVVDDIQVETTRLDELSSGGAQPKPGAQVEIPATAIYDPGNYTISFQPQVGAVITTFSQGMHSATVRYWKVEEGPSKARSFSWTFKTN
jgi:hypothetical protein